MAIMYIRKVRYSHHDPSDTLLPELEKFLDSLKKRGFIDKYKILLTGVRDEYKAKEEDITSLFTKQLEFLYLEDPNLKNKVLRKVKEYGKSLATINGPDLLGGGYSWSVMGKALSDDKRLSEIEKKVLTEKNFTRSLKDNNSFLGHDSETAIKFCYDKND